MPNFSPSLFRRYEKDRRCRFNALLDKLASLLPNFAECNDGEQKWTKAQIVENAIKFILHLQNNIENQAPPNSTPAADTKSTLKLLKKQNKKLREILRTELVPELTEKEFCSMDFSQLYDLIKKKKETSKETDVVEAINDAGDVFVVTTSNDKECSSSADADHTYSLMVQQEAEIEIIDHTDNEIEQQSSAVVIQEQPQTAAVIPQPIIIQMAPLVQSRNLTLPAAQLTPVPPPNKLPLPRIYSSASLVNVYNTPVVSTSTSQDWKLPKEKRHRRRKKAALVEPTIEKSQSKDKSIEKTAKENIKTTLVEPDFVQPSQSVPRAILAEAQEEIVDLTVENEPKNSSKEASKKSSNEGKKAARSSYSIAALCQMSVNIGADPVAGVPDNISGAVNSPGVISLNSTESPRATPTPSQSPMPPPVSQMQPPVSASIGNKARSVQSQVPSQQVKTSSAGMTVANSVKKVIQELKPINDSHAQ